MIYMDHHATTPIDPKVLSAMMPFLTDQFGNPSSSTHRFGWHAKEAVEKARQQIADLIGCTADEIFFTSGATESDNLAIKGIAQQLKRKGNHIITTQVEHSAILDSCKAIERDGFEITYLPVDQFGMIDPTNVKNAITDRTILISVIYANNEVGTINPIREIGEIASEHGVLFHSDAVQGIGKIESNVDRLNLDLMSLTAHKMYGPKGIGALYVRKKRPKIRIAPQTHGGAQEKKLRPGTLNVPGIVGFGEACEVAKSEIGSKKTLALRDRLYNGLIKEIDLIHLNGHPTDRLPGNLNVSIEFVESLTLLEKLENIALSTGSACTSGSMSPSRILTAMGVEDSLARSPIRFGLGRSNTIEQVDEVIEKVAYYVKELRKNSQMYQLKQKGKNN